MRKNYCVLQAIAEKKLTQAEVTRLAKVSSEARLSRIIHFLVRPDADEAIRIGDVLGLPASEIRGGTDDV